MFVSEKPRIPLRNQENYFMIMVDLWMWMNQSKSWSFCTFVYWISFHQFIALTGWQKKDSIPCYKGESGVCRDIFFCFLLLKRQFVRTCKNHMNEVVPTSTKSYVWNMNKKNITISHLKIAFHRAMKDNIISCIYVVFFFNARPLLWVQIPDCVRQSLGNI